MPFLVSRKNLSRSTSRSKSLYFLANRASANSGANSKMMVIGGFLLSENSLVKAAGNPWVTQQKFTRNKKALHFCKALILQQYFGGYDGTRTCDPSIMSFRTILIAPWPELRYRWYVSLFKTLKCYAQFNDIDHRKVYKVVISFMITIAQTLGATKKNAPKALANEALSEISSEWSTAWETLHRSLFYNENITTKESDIFS